MTESNKVVCPCGFIIFTGSVLKARIMKFEDARGVARCKRCKREVVIPNVRLCPEQQNGCKVTGKK